MAANGTAVAVAVRDHGIGMTAAEAARVFDRFWRADPARARTTGGSGLGLSIAAEDTKLHNGWLQAWGSKGNGSNFRLTLPLRQGETDHQVAAPAGTGRRRAPRSRAAADRCCCWRPRRGFRTADRQPVRGGCGFPAGADRCGATGNGGRVMRVLH